jgi:hypothetical protein
MLCDIRIRGDEAHQKLTKVQDERAQLQQQYEILYNKRAHWKRKWKE